ncbi:alpha/beta hydrolase fold family protein (plasmid) [Rhizobium leguminosarum bv. viciae]|nr:alpha/beta hydrolase fold family protein [Rhizobium leguminosarum bv. viciae]
MSKGHIMKIVQTVIAGAVAAAVANVALAARSPGVERNTKGFLEAMAKAGAPPPESLSPADARAAVAAAQAGAKLAPADISEKTISVDGKPLKLTIVRPAGTDGVLPGFMFFHGGGWILGDFPTNERFVRDLVADSGAAAICVNYTLSPEVRYPVAINEAYAATKWVAENGEQISVDGKRLAVVGNSVGGNMAAVVALMAKDKGGAALRAQVLFWPATNANFEDASYDAFATGHFLTKDIIKGFWSAYVPHAEQRQEIYAPPLQATP